MTWGPLSYHVETFKNLQQAMKSCHKLCAVMIDTLGREGELSMGTALYTALATGRRPHLRAAVETDGSWQCAVNVRARSDGPETLPGGLKRVALAYGVLHHGQVSSAWKTTRDGGDT